MKHLVTLVHLLWQRVQYPRLRPLPHRRSFWIGMGLVTLAVVIYCTYFCLLLVTKHNSLHTNGEDLGIMDQAIWNILQQGFPSQTICNTLTDTNCAGLAGVNRFALHVEPILYPISLLYAIWPDPRTLLILQVLVVASGAFPAFWLARLRLQQDWAAVPFALLYLLTPIQHYAVNFDFHAVTLTCALLLYTLYFLVARKTGPFLLFAVLALACKEEIAGVVFLMGLFALLFQHSWRRGLGTMGLALGWTGIGLFIVHSISPTGSALLTPRYAYLGTGIGQMGWTLLSHPISLFQEHVLEPGHLLYLRKLLAPLGYLPLLAPWVLVLAVPTLALNLLSTDPNMYSGHFQYNAEIVPILIFASIEATALLLLAGKWCLSRLSRQEEILKITTKWRHRENYPKRPSLLLLQTGGLIVILGFLLLRAIMATTQYDVYSAMPYARGFIFPQETPHTQLAERFLNQIPEDASVSTQTALVPHLSQRQHIYLFPYAVDTADYLLLDASGYVYPFNDYTDYSAFIKDVLQRGEYGVADLHGGYLLLQHGAPLSQVQPALDMIDKYEHTD